MPSVGTLIWISCRPLIRLAFCVGCGLAITKAGIFPTVAARGAGQIALNIAIPCLLFSKIVPAFDPSNVSALGPLVLVAFLYEAIGLLLAWTIKQFFWVPHQFRYGILVAGGWGNVGDIRESHWFIAVKLLALTGANVATSVILSVTGSAPFNGTTDQNLSVAYISAIIFVFLITLFPFGGHRWIAMDYVGPDIEPEEVREAMRLKRQALFGFLFRQKVEFDASKEHDLDHRSISVLDEKDTNSLQETTQRRFDFLGDTTIATLTENLESPLEKDGRLDSIEPSNIDIPQHDNSSNKDTQIQVQHHTVHNQTLPIHSSTHSLPLNSRNTLVRRQLFREFLKNLLTPPSIAICISFPLALIPKLKALFIPVPGTFIPSAPDGQPPPAFVLDATTFMGAASVPLSLICLGSALARLDLPKKGQWRKLPFGAIGSLAAARLLIMPVLGVLICEGLTNIGIISKDDKVLRYVCIFVSCLPTATTQVFLTQIYSGTGTAQHLSSFLIPQYMLMLISMTALTAYTLELIF